MWKYFLYIVLFTFVACGQDRLRSHPYSNGQISLLQLDSTTILSAEKDSMITIDLNPFLQKQTFDFGTLVKQVKLIPLETTDASLLDDIYKVIVTDSNIYVMDSFKGRGLVVFDRHGKFIKRMTHGQGPGELVRLYDIAYDKEENVLVAYRHSFLQFFTPSGEFIREERLPFGFYNFVVTPDGYLFKTIDRQGNGHLGILKDYTLLVTDKKFKLKSAGIYQTPIGSVIFEYDYLRDNNQTVNIAHMYSDTVYHFVKKTGELEAKYRLDYKKKKLPEHYIYSNSTEFDNAIRQNDYYYFNGRNLETETHNAFFLENSNIGRTAIYRDKLSGHLTGGPIANYNINEIPPIAFPISVSDDWFISIYIPDNTTSLLLNSSILSEEDKEKVKNLNDDDNPVLVFFQLKNF